DALPISDMQATAPRTPPSALPHRSARSGPRACREAEAPVQSPQSQLAAASFPRDRGRLPMASRSLRGGKPATLGTTSPRIAEGFAKPSITLGVDAPLPGRFVARRVRTLIRVRDLERPPEQGGVDADHHPGPEGVRPQMRAGRGARLGCGVGTAELGRLRPQADVPARSGEWRRHRL